MKRLILAALATALLATIAFAEVPNRSTASSEPEHGRYEPAGFLNGGFGSGAFTIPPS